ncbi:icarapin-like [Copidosoma floridanum]|uniref:icarapin-like n=1 Tax=Copidosoma floridanum TaxID=29053 RepID=UPI0006C93D66|nr:icarapin-like [Copidosoma floridanum]
MKSAVGVLLLVGVLALAQAFPGGARDSAESTEIDAGRDKHKVMVLLPPARRNIFDEFGDEDDSSDEEFSMPGMWNPWNPFPDIFTKMQETLKRVRAEMAAALASQLEHAGGLTPWGKIPEGANTTSTTKLLN